MQRIKRGLILAVVMALVAAFVAAPAGAATTNYSETVTGIQIVPITFSRTITASATPATFRIPFKAQVLGVSVHAKSIDTVDGDETYSVDVKEGSASILSSAISIAAAGTIYEGTISDKYIADEATVSVVVTLGGTTPSLTDLTVILTIRRTN